MKRNEELNIRWAELVKKLNLRFDQDFELDGILFMIGLQELNQFERKLNKDQKMDVMHIAVCTLLAPYGYYKFIGRDEEGWPHFEATDTLPHLKPMQQHSLIKEAILEYLQEFGTEKQE
ncbi:MAG: hypothetical protein MH137_08245 [Flavobacteriales bacterium]|nr:hypothetical protein [Flavobacteriales bacterium]